MIPVFAFTISAFIGNEKFSWRKIFGIVLAACGVIYLIDPTKASFSSATTQGDILIILNSLSYGIYVAISKDLITQYGALKSIAWLFIFASLINVPIGLFSLQSVELVANQRSVWLAIAAIVIFADDSRVFLEHVGAGARQPSVVAVYVYLQPLIGTFSAVVFLEEE